MSRRGISVELEPAVLRWARERAGLTPEVLAKKVGTSEGRVADWEETGKLSLVQVDKLAQATYTPVGYLYLETPPDERLPVTDFRSPAGAEQRVPSPDLLAVLDEALQRQDWYRDYLVALNEAPLDFVGALRNSPPAVDSAERIRIRHGLDTSLRDAASNWEEALRLEIERIEESGVLVMRSGIVGSNTHRSLDVSEFRGFALSDPYAPLVFLNGKDALAAQMFTLMHELVHVWMGDSGVSNPSPARTPDREVERYCDSVAAEILVPAALLRDQWNFVRSQDDAVQRLTRRFKVSSLVILRRLRDIDALTWERFRQLYAQEEARFREQAQARESGGDFYRTQRARSSKRFATALVESTLEGRTPWRDAMQLLGIKKVATFNEMARNLGFVV